MPAFLISLLIVVLVLVLLRYVLDAVGLGEPATKVIWIIALVVSIIWLLTGSTLLR